MKQFLLVFLGGGLGSILRYLVSKFLNPLASNFYWGTLAVNIVGCLFIGLFLGLAQSKYLSQQQVLFLATGLCGGFTTFSTFGFEAHSLLKTGAILNFILYTLLSVALGLLAVFLGLWLSKTS